MNLLAGIYMLLARDSYMDNFTSPFSFGYPHGVKPLTCMNLGRRILVSVFIT